MTERKWVGREVKRKEDPRLITGQAAYVGDISFPGMLHVAFVRSMYAHAKILGIDGSGALKRPGVVAVITGEDLQDHLELMPMMTSTEGGGSSEGSSGDGQVHSHHVLSVGKVRHVGEAIAAVVATSIEAAVDAVLEVVVDYDPLPAAVTPMAALAADAPLVFDEMASNVEHVWKRKVGDVEAALAGAHKVVKQHILNQRIAGIPMECRGVVAVPEPATGGLTVWVSHQGPHFFRADLAKTLRLPENSIRAIAPEVGGGFGVKGTMFPEDVVVAALARQFRKPMRWLETRAEHMVATCHGRAQEADIEMAVAEDGKVTAMRMRIVGDVGAYPVAPVIPDITAEMSVGVYQIPAVDIEVTCAFTHTTPVSAYRGAGRPEAAYYIERMMDLIAGEMGFDPIELRRRNFIPPEAFPYKTAAGKRYDSGEYDKALTKALEVAGYEALREEQKRSREGNGPLLGIGLSTYTEICGFGPYESSVVRVDPTGTVTVFTGISPHGQGQETSFAQLVADELGADYDKVQVRHGDTATTPMGWGTGGSRGLVVGGMALVEAAAKVRNKARLIAAHMFEADPDDVDLVDGHYQVRGVPDRKLTLTEIADRAYSDEMPRDMDGGLEATHFYRPPDEVYPFGAQIAVVEVDRETGEVRLRDFISVDDCGQRISPLLVAGQVHGGVAQGVAQALWEEVVFDDAGQLLTGSLMDYAVPHADQLPTFILDETVTPTPHNSLGVKGIGELPTVGSTPAVVNAVMDALKPFGVRHLDMPLRPEKIWRAMQ